MEDTGFPRASQMHTRRRPKAILVLVGVLVILGLLVYGGMRLLGSGNDEDENVDVLPTAVIAPSSTPSPTDGEEEATTPTPTEIDEDENKPTPTKAAASTNNDKSSLAIQILNGSGVSGAAGEVQTVLEDAGYSNITTGNADSFDYEDVSISVKSTKSSFLKLLETDLSDSYTIGDTDSGLTSSEYDAVIIIGQ